MRSLAIVFVMMLPLASLTPRPSLPSSARGSYASSLTGQVAGFRLAGIEPDGDPLYQTVLKARLSPAGGFPAVTIVVDSYLENFKPDTTPILPDLLHPRQTAQNLGGFLQGKALLTDDAGDVLYVGSFLAEAFLDNSNHAVMRLYGSNPSAAPTVALKGTFRLRKDGSLHGMLAGTLTLPPAARRQLLRHQGATISSAKLKSILNTVTVKPHPMMGRATSGSSNAPLRTGFGQQPAARSSGAPSAGRRISPWTVASGIGVIVSLTLAAYLFWSQRRAPSHPSRGGEG